MDGGGILAEPNEVAHQIGAGHGAHIHRSKAVADDAALLVPGKAACYPTRLIRPNGHCPFGAASLEPSMACIPGKTACPAGASNLHVHMAVHQLRIAGAAHHAAHVGLPAHLPGDGAVVHPSRKTPCQAAYISVSPDG